MPIYSPKRLRFYYFFLFCYVVFQLFFVSFLKISHKDTHTNAIKILENYKMLISRVNQSTDLDDTGQYRIVLGKWSRGPKTDVTIVSQCSSNHFPLVDDLFAAWEGPISIAIYSDLEHIPESLWDMAKFLHCYNRREFVMKLVIPSGDTTKLDYQYGYDMVHGADKSISCTAAYMSAFSSRRNYNWKKPYPVNFLRNVAKSGSTTDYILVVDVDMLPNPGLRENFLKFVQNEETNFEKTAFVIPIFEVLKGTPLPRDKEELRELVSAGKARPFYMSPCENCQKLTNYNEWLERRNASGVQVLHRLNWRHPWEPFVITNREAPNFDERFRQYGYNRVSQLCEIHMAGYDFAVLDNAFLVHDGYKATDDFHKTKDDEMKSNRLLYNRFKFQIRFKYPDTDRVC